MPLVVDYKAYFSGEFWGRTNSGKSFTANSIVELMTAQQKKDMVVIMFTNESNFAEGIKEWPDYKPIFQPYFHRNIDEFENDVLEVYHDYNVKMVKNPKTQKTYFNTEKVKRNIFAFIIDEAEFIYRDGYAVRHEQNLLKKGYQMLQKDWGIPRKNFMMKIKELSGLPTNFCVTSKVGDVHEEKEVMSADRTKSWKQWIKVEGDAYRLPSPFEYEPTVRVHHFNTQLETKIKDAAGRMVNKVTWWGELVKQKADRDELVVMEKPTIKKINIRLDQLRTLRLLKEKKAKRLAEKEQVTK